MPTPICDACMTGDHPNPDRAGFCGAQFHQEINTPDLAAPVRRDFPPPIAALRVGVLVWRCRCICEQGGPESVLVVG